MKKLTVLFIFSSYLFACNGKDKQEEEVVQKPKVPVEVTTIQTGFVSDNLELFGTTAYLRRSLVTAPIPAFITKVNVRLGDRVSQGEVLYRLESKERKALGNQPVLYDSSLAGYGIIQVKAPASGIISLIDRQQAGEYILEGAPLCTISQSSDLVFQVNVPFEYTGYTRSGTPCTIVLPDNTKHNAVFVKPLTAMNVSAQTQIVLVRTTDGVSLPEGLIAKVLVGKGSGNNNQVLPKECVLSDEMMQQFWIMKLINDSTAVKVPVIIGNKNKSEIEIITPRFTANDKILSNGNYGLPDTALVKVTGKK